MPAIGFISPVLHYRDADAAIDFAGTRIRLPATSRI